MTKIDFCLCFELVINIFINILLMSIWINGYYTSGCVSGIVCLFLHILIVPNIVELLPKLCGSIKNGARLIKYCIQVLVMIIISKITFQFERICKKIFLFRCSFKCVWEGRGVLFENVQWWG